MLRENSISKTHGHAYDWTLGIASNAWVMFKCLIDVFCFSNSIITASRPKKIQLWTTIKLVRVLRNIFFNIGIKALCCFSAFGELLFTNKNKNFMLEHNFYKYSGGEGLGWRTHKDIILNTVCNAASFGGYSSGS